MNKYVLHYCANCANAITPEEAERDISVRFGVGMLHFCSEECCDELGDETSVYPEDNWIPGGWEGR